MAYTDLQLRAVTQIAYMDLKVAYHEYCETHYVDTVSLKELLSEDDIQTLRKLGLTEKELESWKIAGIHDTNRDNGFYACIIETGENEAIVGFRGSEGMDEEGQLLNDWLLADLGLLNSVCTTQHLEAERFLKKYLAQLKSYNNICLTGHSLGGNLAEYTAIVSSKYGLDYNITQCVSFDGPGFSDEFIRAYQAEIQKMAPVMKHYRWSLVGRLLFDLPEVSYDPIAISNDVNVKDNKKYNPLTRHDTKYIIFDKDGNVKKGTIDIVALFASAISKGFEIVVVAPNMGSMIPRATIRDFTDIAKEQLLSAVREVEDEKWWNITRWDCWYRVEKFFGQLYWERYANNVDTYYRKIVDINNSSVKNIEDIFTKVYEVDNSTAGKISSYNDQLNSNVYQKLIAVRDSINPM